YAINLGAPRPGRAAALCDGLPDRHGGAGEQIDRPTASVRGVPPYERVPHRDVRFCARVERAGIPFRMVAVNRHVDQERPCVTVGAHRSALPDRLVVDDHGIDDGGNAAIDAEPAAKSHLVAPDDQVAEGGGSAGHHDRTAGVGAVRAGDDEAVEDATGVDLRGPYHL